LFEYGCSVTNISPIINRAVIIFGQYAPTQLQTATMELDGNGKEKIKTAKRFYL